MAEAPTKSTIKQLGLLQSMRDELSDQKKILKDNADNVKDGILTQNQMLEAQDGIRKLSANRTRAENKIKKIQKIDAKKRSAKEKKDLATAKITLKTVTGELNESQELMDSQKSLMVDAAKARGVSVEKFMELKGTFEEANIKLEEMKAQQAKLVLAGKGDAILAKKIQNQEKRKERREQKLEGGRLTRAKDAIKAAAFQATTLTGILGGIKSIGQAGAGGASKGGKRAAKGMKSMFGLIMKGAMLALLPAILLFFNSPLWTKTKTFLMETALPAIMKFYHDAIVPAFTFIKEKILPIIMKFFGFLKDTMLPIVMNVFGKLFDNIGALFGTLGEAFQKFSDGDIIGGIIDMFKGIATFIFGLIDIAITFLYSTIAGIFGLEGTDSVFGSIGKFFTDMYDKVVGYISGGWEFIKEKLATAFGAITQIGEWLGGIFTKVITYIKGIFGFSEDGFKFPNLFDLAFAGIDLAINTIRGIFGFGDSEEDFKLSKFIGDIFTKIVAWFENLFNIDFSKLLADIVPEFIKDSWLGRKLGLSSGSDEDIGQGSGIESDAQTRAKIEEQRQKGNIADISGQVDPMGGMSDALNRRQLEKDVVAGNSGGTIITTNQVSTTKNVNATTNVSSVTDGDPILEAVTLNVE